MSNRILKGVRLNGTFGFDVSKPGFNVTTANIMQMAFTSDISIPVVVTKGSLVSYPVSGPAPFGSGSANGARITANYVAFGRTVYPIPMIAAIATASDWSLPFNTHAAQLGYIANQWHSYISETPVFGNTSYGSSGIFKRNTSGNASATGEVDMTWASAKFIAVANTNGVTFTTNCASAVTIKYLILENV
jgi:hypothetical protein